LNSVDLPTLGRPTMAMVGSMMGAAGARAGACPGGYFADTA
jgi:hypothetical protein